MSDVKLQINEMAQEMKAHLLGSIFPFWKSMRDDKFGGYYGELSFDLELNKQAEKGCILNSRETWFFANVYLLYKNGYLTDADFAAYGYTAEDVKGEALHAYCFLKDKCIDHENGGILWSLNYDGTPLDTTKHTYNQAFCIYALASYYDAFGDEAALKLAFELVDIIEKKCTDELGYLEARTITFAPESNEKLSENGVMADKTMNTLLHVFEAYSELYRVSGNERIGARLAWILDTFADKIYNPALHRQEVFFDTCYNSIIDLHSYGHDIETAWLIDRGVDILGGGVFEEKMTPITADLSQNILHVAFDGRSLANECERGVVNDRRIWWVQAESVLGFLNAYQRGYASEPGEVTNQAAAEAAPTDRVASESAMTEKCMSEVTDADRFAEAALAQWQFIKDFIIDPRAGSEWFHEVRPDGTPYEDFPIVEPWKCPYHNGRMCIEVIRRAAEM